MFTLTLICLYYLFPAEVHPAQIHGIANALDWDLSLWLRVFAQQGTWRDWCSIKHITNFEGVG